MRRNQTRRSLPASAPLCQGAPVQARLHLAFEPAQFLPDSTKSNGARSFLSCPPGCGHDGSKVLPCHHHQGTAQRQVRRLVFPEPKETQPMASRTPRHTPARPATTKARSPSQIASQVNSCSLQLTSVLAKKSRMRGARGSVFEPGSWGCRFLSAIVPLSNAPRAASFE
jgi:hypothetical protein